MPLLFEAAFQIWLYFIEHILVFQRNWCLLTAQVTSLKGSSYFVLPVLMGKLKAITQLNNEKSSVH